MIGIVLGVVFSIIQIIFLGVMKWNILSLMVSFIVIVVGIVSFKNAKNNVKYIQLRFQKKSFLIYAFILLISMCMFGSFMNKSLLSNLKSTLFLANSLIYFFVWLLELFVYLYEEKQFSFNQQRSQGRKYFILSVLAHIVPSLIYLLAYYPGIMVMDSVHQWQQVHGNVWNDWHPMGHTFLIKLTTFILDSPVSFVVLQIVIYAVTMGYFHKFLYQKKISNGYLCCLLIFTSLYPYFPLVSVTIVKDVLFTLCLLGYMIHLNEIFSSKGVKLQNKLFVFTLFLTNIGLVFFRHNGWPVFILTFIILIPFTFKKQYMKLYLVSIFVSLLYLGVTGPVYEKFNVVKSDNTESMGIFLQIIGGIVTHEGDMDSSEKEFVNNLMPLDQWHKNYNNTNVDKVKFSSKLDKDFMRENSGELIEVAWNLTKKNPYLAIKAYLSQTQILWKANIVEENLRPVFRTRYFETYRPVYFLSEKQIEELKPNYKEFDYSQYGDGNIALRKIIEEEILEPFNEPNIKQFILPGFSFILSLFLLMILVLKQKIYDILSLLPWILNIASMFVAVPAQDIRYGYINLYGVIFLFALTSFKKNGENILHPKKNSL